MKIQEGKSDTMTDEGKVACESLKLESHNETDEEYENNSHQLSWKERRAKKENEIFRWLTENVTTQILSWKALLRWNGFSSMRN